MPTLHFRRESDGATWLSLALDADALAEYSRLFGYLLATRRAAFELDRRGTSLMRDARARLAPLFPVFVPPPNGSFIDTKKKQAKTAPREMYVFSPHGPTGHHFQNLHGL